MLTDLPVEAAVFDLWQTLVHTDSVDPAAIWGRHTGVPRGRITPVMHALEETFMRGAIPLSEWPYAVATRAGLDLTHEQATAIRDDIADMWVRESHPYPGVQEMLEALRSAGKKTALCSNANPFTLNVVKTYFKGLLDAVIVSCRVQAAKPDPRIYQAVIDKLGIPPERMIYVGDGGHQEISGAKRLGFKTVLIESPEGHVRNRPEDDPGTDADWRLPMASGVLILLLSSLG